MSGFKTATFLAFACAIGLSGCKIIKTPTAAEVAESANAAFDPDKMVAGMMETKILPFIDKKAAPFAEVMAAANANLESAGEKYGHKEKQGNAPWTFATRFEGKIVAVETQSRAGYADVDTDGDGKADIRMQIGPAVKGTAIRDSLDFVNFNEFKNQIEWAQFGKSINISLNNSLLSKLPRDTLTGKMVKAAGAFPMPKAGELPLFVPATAVVE